MKFLKWNMIAGPNQAVLLPGHRVYQQCSDL